MSRVWFWLVIMVAAFVALIAVLAWINTGGARELAREMVAPSSEKKPKKKKDAEAEDAPAEAADDAA